MVVSSLNYPIVIILGGPDGKADDPASFNYPSVMILGGPDGKTDDPRGLAEIPCTASGYYEILTSSCLLVCLGKLGASFIICFAS